VKTKETTMSKQVIAILVSALFLAVTVLTLPGSGGQSSSSTGAAANASERGFLLLEWEQARDKIESEMASLREKLAEEMAALEQRIAEEVAQDSERAKSLAEEQACRAEQWARTVAERFTDTEPEALPAPYPAGAGLPQEENGWLGVAIEEVTAEKAQQLKLPAERGVLIAEVSAESPAAKAGLKAGDVITEFNGQRVEGTFQFRRLVRETPAGRTVALAIWREGRSQTLTAKLGRMGERHGDHVRIFGPHDFDFEVFGPELEMPPMPMLAPAPMLGVEAEEISGQLGGYFGAPDGEGILVREVRPGSPAEKAGLKAGDVITKAEGERVRTIRDLRSKLREKREQKNVSIVAIRRGSEMSFNVEIEPRKPSPPGAMFRRRAL